MYSDKQCKMVHYVTCHHASVWPGKCKNISSTSSALHLNVWHQWEDDSKKYYMYMPCAMNMKKDSHKNIKSIAESHMKMKSTVDNHMKMKSIEDSCNCYYSVQNRLSNNFFLFLSKCPHQIQNHLKKAISKIMVSWTKFENKMTL